MTPTTEYEYKEANYTITGSGYNVFVTSVTLKVKAAASSNWYEVTVPVNKTFTRSGAVWTDADFK
jgi:hypothetical protein